MALEDHDQLHCDPVMAVLADKLKAQRRNCQSLAGKSTLNRLQRGLASGSDACRKISRRLVWIEALLVRLFLDAHSAAPEWITLDLHATVDPLWSTRLAIRG